MITLSDKAMLSTVKFSACGFTKNDRRTNQKVSRALGVREDAGRYTKILLADELLSKLTNMGKAVHGLHHTMTIPFDDKGWRVLPAAMYLDHRTKLSEIIEKFNFCRDREFVPAYPDLVQAARTRLNGEFNESDYPPVEVIASKFEIRLQYRPMPDAGHILVNIGNEELDRVRIEAHRDLCLGLKEGMLDLLTRLRDGVKDMVERIGSYHVDDKGKVQNPFRDTAVTNLQEICAIVPKLNLLGDPQIDAINREIQQALLQHNAEQLRDDHIIRKSTVTTAEQILARLNGVLA